MRSTIIVSARGQITLPAAVRKRLGIEPGGVLVLDESKGEIILRPVSVVEIETYSDDAIALWDEEDRVTPDERAELIRRLGPVP
ncbi:MAG: AbrB/MazE/SpoVT family DNA-binding domain-containing protein [Actinobacteria bacterium]|nr:AbrB/MazE/SpoVT family DNA-binding domain-containing protein [Actinomycetota bacterium]